MTDLTPTPDQLQSWIDKVCYPHSQGVGPSFKDKELASLAFKAGADQELEACCEYIRRWFANPQYRIAELRAARRPKAPSLKEQALEALKDIEREYVIGATTDTIRRALLAEPEAVGPTDEEFISYWYEVCEGEGEEGILRFARYVRRTNHLEKNK